MKLYEIPKGSQIKATLNSGKECFITFYHVDGAFSYCTLNDGDSDSTIHLAASTPLRKEGDYYVIGD
jgi:hypothetical protein